MAETCHGPAATVRAVWLVAAIAVSVAALPTPFAPGRASLSVAGDAGTGARAAVATTATTARAGGVNSVFWTLPASAADDYAAKAFAFALQGLANRGGTAALFVNTTALDFDFPGSDDAWRRYLATNLSVAWRAVPVVTPNATGPGPGLCDLAAHFVHAAPGGMAVYPDDGFSVYVALTMAGLDSVLPVSARLLAAHPCLAALLPVAVDFRSNASLQFADKMAAHHWAVDHLLPRCSRTMLFNANMGPNADAGQDVGTILSVDLPVAEGAFVMNLCPLWTCDTGPNSTDLNCGPHSHRVATPHEAALFAQVVASRDELVALWGWSDPEHAYTNTTSHAGGVVFCTFSTPNLSFWRSLGLALGTTPLPLPVHDSGRPLDPNKVYVTFETNEGDTPRIVTSQFTGAWLSPNRGSVPVAWAVDPLLAEQFPALWNFYAASATPNDTFVAGVDGAGYVFVAELGAHEEAYEQRAGRVLRDIGPNVVDTGVAVAGWPDIATYDMLERYVANAAHGGAGRAPDAFVNACGSHWGQPVNGWLGDGTPVINSVCYGPAGNDTSNGHYLYYYRDHLDPTDPAADLASRILWASAQPGDVGSNHTTTGAGTGFVGSERRGAHSSGGSGDDDSGGAAKSVAATAAAPPQFILAFGGLGLYGGHDDFFLFVQRVMASLHEQQRRQGLQQKPPQRGAGTGSGGDGGGGGKTFEVVGAQEMARLAREAGAARRTSPLSTASDDRLRASSGRPATMQ